MRRQISPAEKRRVHEHARKLETRAKPFAAALSSFLKKLARREVRALADRGFLHVSLAKHPSHTALRVRVTKAILNDDEAEMIALLNRYGVRTASDAGAETATALGGDWIAAPDVLRGFMRSRTIRVREFLNDAGRDLEERTKRILQTAEDSDRQPTIAQMTSQLYADLTTAGAFSPARAERIARTETAAAENFGIFEGMKAVGVNRIRWLTIMDGRERDDHAAMHGVETTVGVPFVLPDGTRLLYPCDEGPPEQVINCRCVVVPIYRGDEFDTAQTPPPVEAAPIEAPTAPPEEQPETVDSPTLGVSFIRSARSQENDDEIIWIDPNKLDAALQRDSGFYVGPGGSGAAISGRYQEFERFLEQVKDDGTPIEMSELHLDAAGQPHFTNGRHRFAVLRDQGAKALPVAVAQEDAKAFKRKFGTRKR